MEDQAEGRHGFPEPGQSDRLVHSGGRCGLRPENLGIDPVEIRERVDRALEDVEMYEHRKKAPHLLLGRPEAACGHSGSSGHGAGMYNL